MHNIDTMKVLNDLVRTSENSRNEFVEAACEATKPQLKDFFRRRSGDCETTVVELQALLLSIGAIPNNMERNEVGAFRDRNKAPSAVGNTNVSSLVDVEHAEDRVEAAYVKALSTVLPPNIRSVVERQYNGAIRNHDHIRDLRNAYMDGT